MALSAESATSPVHTERRCSCHSTSAAKTSASRRSPKTELVMKVGLPLQLGSVQGVVWVLRKADANFTPFVGSVPSVLFGTVALFDGGCSLLVQGRVSTAVV